MTIRENLGGESGYVISVAVCGYFIYAGPNSEYVAQLYLRSLQLKMKTVNLIQII
ncbi:hypothetical protein BDV24DRAFT_123936 [Aspergillus arachidicola]|uniref:Uncharacterized protein n=1 Tax=Aspergillus arachidicola TaxID=656916 RepID=A0A5N6YM44_9EURO|nr:hypothetical protein BDV24DRAFT_123936 [Aspergillus arachidicola]